MGTTNKFAAAVVAAAVLVGGAAASILSNNADATATTATVAPSTPAVGANAEQLVTTRVANAVIDTNLASSAARDSAVLSAAKKAAAEAKAAAKKKAAARKAAAAKAAAAKAAAAFDLRRASMWDRIAHCESTNNWSINTGNGYYGGLQFSVATWRAYGGGQFAARADLAPRGAQITVANRVYDRRGGASGDWSCARSLGIG